MGLKNLQLENLFTPLRLFAAALVIVGHSYDLQNQSDFAKRLTGYSLGAIGVFIFFLLSGYLVYSSTLRSSSTTSFVFKRALRILPGLWVMLAITSAAVFLFFHTEVSATIRYATCNGVIIRSCYSVPPAFADNASDAINGSLWTLKYEIGCYAVVALLLTFGLLRSRPAIVILILLLALTFIFGHSAVLVNARELGIFFLAGIMLAIYRPAYPPKKDIPDFSYGLYIYAFPIQQTIIWQTGGLSPVLLAVVTLAATLPISAASWYLIESPALRLKNFRLYPPPHTAPGSE